MQLIPFIHQYGYFGLMGILVLGIVGLPLPDETILTAVGFLVYRGHLSYFPSLLAGVAGGAIGISLSYAMGAVIGRPLILKYGAILHLSEQKLAKVEGYFERYGGITLIGGFFIPGVRHLTAIVAGMGGMRYPRFALAAYTGVCIWITTFITLGRFAGPQIEALRTKIPENLLWFAAGGIVLVLCILFVSLKWRRHNNQ